MAGEVCPGCGAPAAAWTAGCACAPVPGPVHGPGTAHGPGGAPDAFEPLRIRPYVQLRPATPDAPDGPDGPRTAGAAGAAAASGPGDGAGYAGHGGYEAPGGYAHQPTPERHPGTAHHPADGQRDGTGREPAPGGRAGAVPPPHSPAVPRTGGLPDGAGAAYDAGLVDVTPPRVAAAAGPGRARRRAGARGRRGSAAPGPVAGVLVAVVAVVGAAAFAGGLFDGDGSADRVAPDPRPSVPPWPDAVTGAPTSAPEASGASSHSARPSTLGPSVSRRSTSGRPSDPGEATSPEATASAVPVLASPGRSTPAREPAPRPPSPRGSASEAAGGPVLGRGDRGRDVSDLQHRLRQVGLYDGPPHGRYDKDVERAVAAYQSSRGVTTDPSGVYGADTRAALEAETAGR
ncbi:peptidoglycan-binding protein [Streptomyces sp. DH12]|uniref:peptidoglycan-binding protein n=1 Tax=Streptomyces sp. DH12 TaxID=2857010 RepID=UPI001E45C236|nr:peptidoglycan-binding protein [Streptomyces sp. DH12]